MPLKDSYQAINFTNIYAFASDTEYVELAKMIDDRLAGNEDFVSIQEMLGMEPNLPLKSDKNRVDKVNKILGDMGRYLESKGYCLEKAGVRCKGLKYRYPQECPDPFKEHRRVIKKFTTKEMYEISALLANFLPSVFRESLLEGTALLGYFQSNRKDIPNINAENNSLLTGVQHMKEILEAIDTKEKVYVRYKRKYNREVELELHPQYLKEYNGRWYVIGRTIRIADDGVTELETRDKQNLALDRIEDLDVTGESEYLATTYIDYNEYFSDIVGVTHDDRWPNTLHIELKVHDPYVYNLLRTKKLHLSQKEEELEGNLTVTLDVRPNKELTTKILSFGSAIEVMGPKEYRAHISEEITKMRDRY